MTQPSQPPSPSQSSSSSSSQSSSQAPSQPSSQAPSQPSSPASPSSSLGSLARVVLVCGLAVALTAATVGSAFFGTTTWLTLVPFAGGVVAALAGAVMSLRGAGVDASGARAGARVALECALAVAAAVVVNLAALKYPATVDVTRSKRNTLVEESVLVARSLKSPVTVRATLDADDRAWAELEELVDRYARETDELKLERVSPDRDRAASMQAGDDKVVLVAGERHQKVHWKAGAPDQEAQLTTSLRAVSTGRRARVYILAGHGEAAADDEGPLGLRRFAQALVDEGLEVVPLPLSLVGRVPDDAAAVVVAGAKHIDADAAALQSYVDAGGRALLLLEPGAESFASLLGSVGVQPNDDVVVDASTFAGLLGGPETAAGVAYATHPVTTKLGGAMTHFPRARSLAENPGTPAVVTALVQTGADAFGETHAQPGAVPALDDDDIKGPLTLAYAAETALPSSPRKSRVVVVGDATFAENQAIGLGANRDLAVNAVLWLVEKEQDIAVRPRGRGGNLLLLTPTARERIAFVLLYGMPVLLLCAGLAISAIRRRR